MKIAADIEPPVRRSRWVPILVIGLALTVLAATLVWSALDLRASLHSQIVLRQGDILEAVTRMQHANDQTNGITLGALSDPGEQLQLALEVSRFRNVLGVRLYSADGNYINALPYYITTNALPAASLPQLRELRSVTYFIANARIQDHDLLADPAAPTTPLLFVEVPLPTEDQQPQLAGVIQFLMDGSSIATEYAVLDRNLALKFSAAFLVAAVILAAGLGFALRRVQRANEKLAERTSNLLQANRELALAARTSAVGAVASHLIHGLKNPLIGLRSFVHAHTTENNASSDTEWQMAQLTTQRMEELINRVVRVLQEQQSGAEYEVSIAELVKMLALKAKATADAAGVQFESKVLFDRVLSNREADLILLVLENLVQNAIEATPAGKHVELRVTGDTGAAIFEVRDQGPGLPAALAARLFTPVTSGKKGGGGIGLAISKQLAQSLGAELELAASGADGSVFRLTLPAHPSGTTPQTRDEPLLAIEQTR